MLSLNRLVITDVPEGLLSLSKTIWSTLFKKKSKVCYIRIHGTPEKSLYELFKIPLKKMYKKENIWNTFKRKMVQIKWK